TPPRRIEASKAHRKQRCGPESRKAVQNGPLTPRAPASNRANTMQHRCAASKLHRHTGSNAVALKVAKPCRMDPRHLARGASLQPREHDATPPRRIDASTARQKRGCGPEMRKSVQNGPLT